MPYHLRRIAVALLLCCSLVVGGAACGDGGDGGDNGAEGAQGSTSSAEREKYNRAKFAANAGLAAGATYQWIIKPYRQGKFKKGAKGRTFTGIKAAVAGAFAYNRLRAAQRNAKGDPVLTKVVAPLAGAGGLESLQGLAGKLRKGDATDDDVGTYEELINGLKENGKEAGVKIVDKVPTTSQLKGG